LSYGGYRLYQAEMQKRAQASAAQSSRAAGRAVTVVASDVRTGDIPVEISALGTVTAFQTVAVKTRLDGQLTKVLFHEGQFVHAGDVLAEIDPRPYEVQLAQAQGQMARDQAQLKDAQVNLERNKALFAAQVIAKQQLDTQASLVGQYEGAIAADQAQIDNAKLQLTYSKIIAPISGRIGLRQVDQGNMVHTSDANGIAVITQLQPISVLFSIPEDNLQEVLKKLRSDARLPVEAYDRNGDDKLATGTLVTVDNQIDVTTGTSKLKAIFDNKDNILFPNQFVNVKLRLDVKRGVLIVPVAAVQRGPQGTFVYLVQDGKAKVQPVTTGVTQGTRIEITEGLSAGQQVVTDGGDKLADGIKVDVHTNGNNNGGRRKQA
jgi:multidrug efflux system membrane fusion protein